MNKAILALTLVFALTLAGCSRDGNIKPPQELSEFTPVLKVETLWTAQVGRGADESGVRLQPAFADETLYVASTDGTLKAINMANGKSLWRKVRPWRAEHDTSYAAGPTVVDGVLYIGTLDGSIYAFEAKTGTELWQIRLSSSMLAAPVVTDDLLLARTNNGNVVALNRKDGSRAWLYDQSIVPSLSLRGNGNLLVSHGVVFLGSDDGKLVALRLDTGDRLWERQLTRSEGRTDIQRLNDADGEMLLSGTTLYTSTYHGNVIATDARSGQFLWQQPFSSYVGLALEGNVLVGVDDESNVWAWSTDGGGNLWKQGDLAWRWLGTPATQNGFVIVGDLEGYVHWLSLSDGSFAARVRMSHNPIRSKPLVLSDGRVVVEDAMGNLTAWKVSEL